jgi:hypothetical protein
MKKLLSLVLGLVLFLPAASAARSVRKPGIDGLCGTRISGLAISYARHKFNQRRQARARADRVAFGQEAAAQGPTVTKHKNIAVIEDDGTIFPPPNLFDLLTEGVQFKRSGPATRAERFFGGVTSDRGDRIEIGDDDSRQIDLPFSFRFYGVDYTQVFLNSDGNLTFTRAESSSTARSLGRFLEGPPRIAIDFVDLDPSAASGDAGVYLLVEPEMVRVTWLEVPEFDVSNSNTLQLTLYPHGRITMGYDGVAATDGIVGVSPGGPGTVNLVDYSLDLPFGRSKRAIAESFRSVPEIDDIAYARTVFSAVRHEYTHLVTFADFPVDLGDAFAYHSAVKNDILGIGRQVFDFSDLFGSPQLESFVQMGSLANYPFAPDQFITFSEAPGIGILAHEVGHRWLAFAHFNNDQGHNRTDLLGRQMAHWSFLMDTDGSVMEGNDIRDNGDGTFTTVATWQGYSALDEYLMGLRRPTEVPPFFYVSGSSLDPEGAPSTGVIIQGQRQDVTINQVIAAEGPRAPAVGAAPKKFHVAFALLGRPGEPPSLDSVKKVNQYRNRLATYFRQETEGRGRIVTSLRLQKLAPPSAVESPTIAPQTVDLPASDTGPPGSAPRQVPSRRGRRERLQEHHER